MTVCRVGTCLVLGALWGTRGSIAIHAQGAFPFAIKDGAFYFGSTPVFLHILNYQPLEPGQAEDGEIRQSRIQNDLRRLRSFQGGNNPVVVRVHAQPTAQFPNRMPETFYDGIRALGFWIVRDVYFDADFSSPKAIDKGKSAIDAVIAEVAAAGAFDRIFAWELAKEYPDVGTNAAVLENFLREMRDHVKARMAEPGREGYSNWTGVPTNRRQRTPAIPRNTSGSTALQVSNSRN